MSVNGQTFIRRFEEYCPLWLAEEGDPVGLHIGTLDKEIKTVMMTLDVRPEVVAEAIEKKVDLLIAKHPPIFRPISRLTTDDPQQKMYADLLKHDIAVYAAHTNMDIIEDGLNDWFCELLNIEETTYLKQTHQVALKKLVVFVPTVNSAEMRAALAQAGAGQLGNYEQASFSVNGTGRFVPTADAKPAIGEPFKAEQVEETSIDVVFPETLEKAVLTAMHDVHPYEEPAFDLFTLERPAKTYGIGRVGHLPQPMTVDAFAAQIKATFGLDGLRVVLPHNHRQTVQKVAICGGSGGNFYTDAVKHQADVYITGDIYYHTAHDMQAQNLIAIDPGHHIEILCVPKFIEKMVEWNKENNWDLTIIPATANTNPFVFR